MLSIGFRPFSISVVLFLASACGASPVDSDSGDPLPERLGFSELAMGVPTAPDGFVDFYIGEAALEQYAATGTFEPSADVDYSMIRVPESAVTDALRLSEPVTYSLCDPSRRVVLFHQASSPAFRAPGPEEVANCTPWVQHFDGRVTIEYESGEPGVYGFVQVGVLPNGNLRAGALMDGALPSACDEDGSVSRSRLMLGSWVSDDSPDDPLLATCNAPPLPEEGR